MNLRRLFILFILATLLYSCSSPRYIYSASPPNNPYFTEKGESKFTAYYSGGSSNGDGESTGGMNRGFDLQGAYAVADRWAVTADYSYRKERDSYGSYATNFFESSVINYKRHMTLLGAGYFLPLDRYQTSYLTIFGGFGFGKFSMVDNGLDKSMLTYSRFHSTKVNKYYIQPGLNFITGPFFRMALFTRFSFLHYGGIKSSYTNEEMEYFTFNKVNNKTLGYAEPGLNFQIGLPNCNWLKIDATTMVTSHPFNDLTKLRSRGFSGSIGLSFDFSKMSGK